MDALKINDDDYRSTCYLNFHTAGRSLLHGLHSVAALLVLGESETVDQFILPSHHLWSS